MSPYLGRAAAQPYRNSVSHCRTNHCDIHPRLRDERLEFRHGSRRAGQGTGLTTPARALTQDKAMRTGSKRSFSGFGHAVPHSMRMKLCLIGISLSVKTDFSKDG